MLADLHGRCKLADFGTAVAPQGREVDVPWAYPAYPGKIKEALAHSQRPSLAAARAATHRSTEAPPHLLARAVSEPGTRWPEMARPLGCLPKRGRREGGGGGGALVVVSWWRLIDQRPLALSIRWRWRACYGGPPHAPHLKPISRYLSSPQVALTGPGDHLTECVGSALYMAPEVEHEAAYGVAADIFSFGAMAYECFYYRANGEDFYEGMNLFTGLDVFREPVTSSPQQMPERPSSCEDDAVWKCICDCLTTDPAKRPAAAAAALAMRTHLSSTGDDMWLSSGA